MKNKVILQLNMCWRLPSIILCGSKLSVLKSVGWLFWHKIKKKNCAWGVRVFCECRHKWRTFRSTWPTLPGPGRQPLGGSISLKFLLETRLQSESWYFR